MKAVVPVKGLQYPKSRLADLLSIKERANLTLVMMKDVISALLKVEELSGVIVISPDTNVLSSAKEVGAESEVETEPTGYNHAVSQAAKKIVNDNGEGMLIIPGDVPLITTDDIAAILNEHSSTPAVTLIPTRADGGTNALALSPPNFMRPAFGIDSFKRHEENSLGLGIKPSIIERPNLALDIDTADDLRVLLTFNGNLETLAFLNAINIKKRL